MKQTAESETGPLAEDKLVFQKATALLPPSASLISEAPDQWLTATTEKSSLKSFTAVLSSWNLIEAPQEYIFI